MKKVKLFIENFIVYGFGGLISKIVPVVMVPVIARLMPNTYYYGVYDLFHTVVSFASALALMGTYDAMYRLFFESEETDYRRKVCSNSLLVAVITSFISATVLFVLRRLLANVILGDEKLFYLIELSALSALIGTTNSIVSAPTRMQNKRTVFLIANTVSPIVSYAISIPMLLNGLYLIALPIASIISATAIEVSFGIANRKWFSFQLFDFEIIKDILRLSIPLFPNVIIYWIFNSCDRLMISTLLGTSAVGIYSVGSKLGAFSQLIYTAFAGGWQYFAFSTMKEEKQVQSNSNVFEYLALVSFVSFVFVCALSFTIYRTLFVGDYISGYTIAPYLFLAPLLQMLEQINGNQFLVIKKPWPTVMILGIGAITNILLNYLLIPIFGIEGAAIATVLGYLVSVIVCSFTLAIMKLFIVPIKTIICFLLMLIYFVIWRFWLRNNLLLCILEAILCIGFFLCIYWVELKKVIGYVRRRSDGME